MALVITDLDNTLYDWVTYFSQSFTAMLEELQRLSGVEREVLLDEFRAVHQRYHNSEQPYALLELPSVQRAFAPASREELAKLLDPCLHAFNRERKRTLKPYPGVVEGLESLVAAGHTLVAYTEAVPINSYYRLVKLDLKKYLRRLYATVGEPSPEHPDPGRARKLEMEDGFVRPVPREERKPNPQLLLDICRQEGFPREQALYVGDSLTRDVVMAVEAGVFSVWARYGTDYDPALWATLVRVTHWTAEDVAREERSRPQALSTEPSATIRDFREVLELASRLPVA